MQNPLTERCFQLIQHDKLKRALYEILQTLYGEKEFPENLMTLMVENFLTAVERSDQKLDRLLSDFVSVLFLSSLSQRFFSTYQERLMAAYRKILLHPDSYDDSLVHSYLAVIACFFDFPFDGVEIHPLPSGFVLEGIKEVAASKDRVVLRNQIDIALNMLMTALMRQDRDLVEKASKIILAFANCLDDDGQVLIGLWSSDCVVDKNPFFATTYLTLYAFNALCHHPRMEKMLQIQAEVIARLPEHEIEAIGERAIVLAFAMDHLLNQHMSELVHEIKFSDARSYLLQDVGLIVDKIGNFSTYLTLSGIHQSLGSILSEDVQVIAMGPHFFPLGDLSKFGIFQAIDKEHESPVSYDKVDGKTLIKGMTKIIHADSTYDSPKPSETWLNLEVSGHPQRITLTVSLLGESCKMPLAFAFFIKSIETQMIGARAVRPKSFDKYVGPSQQVVFKGSKKNFTIKPCFNEKMHLIPLQGGERFWGADFLMACELSEFSKPYTWEFH